MKLETNYYRAHRDGNEVRVGKVDRKDPITIQEIPRILFKRALGKFPALEEALKQREASIPKSWTVGNLLAATCVGTAVMLREDLGLPALTPQEVSLLVDDYHLRLDVTGERGYCMMGFEVNFPDVNDFEGSVRMPNFFQHLEGLWGLPWFCSPKNKYEPLYDDTDLFDTETKRFTQAGLRLVDFVAKTIAQKS